MCVCVWMAVVVVIGCAVGSDRGGSVGVPGTEASSLVGVVGIAIKVGGGSSAVSIDAVWRWWS